MELEAEQVSTIVPSVYRYQELHSDHIRVLQVTCESNDNANGVISARLQPFHVSRLPHFIALSYAWPPAGSPTQTLFCDNQFLTVPKHVYSALENLCPPNGSGSFAIWIDAICINQADDSEKSDQVSRMASIYSLTSEVVVWLGESVTVDKHRREIESLAAHAAKLKDSLSEDEYRKSALSSVKRRVQAAINSFTKSAWFRRLWVIQELCLGSTVTVMCGHCFINWESLNRLHRIRYSKATEEEILDHLRLQFMESCRRHCSILDKSDAGADEIIRFFENLQLQQVSLPIDRVYALICLMPDRLRQKIKIDYSLGEEYWKEYMNLARLLLCERSGLMILSVSYSLQRLPALPSWCPDWNNMDREAQPRVELPRRYSWDNEDIRTRVEQPMVLSSDNCNFIRIAGFSIGVVRQSYRPTAAVDEFPSKAFARAWLSWQSATLLELESSSTCLPDPGCKVQRHVQNLLMDSLCHDGNTYRADRIPTHDWPKVMECYWKSVKYCETVVKSPEPQSPSRLDWGENDGYDFLKGRATWRSGTYFFTDQGHIGRGVTKERPGDVLVALHTAPTAFLLRYQNGSDVGELIGEVYVEDFKDFTTLRTEGKSYEWFTIG